METQLIATLKHHKLNITKSRLLVYEVLSNENSPISMNEIILKLQHQVNRVTVYRIISLYQKIHIVALIQTGWKYKLELSDNFNNHHHHLNCKVCGASENFYEPFEFKHEIQNIADKMNFNLQSHTLELTGVCNACQVKVI